MSVELNTIQATTIQTQDKKGNRGLPEQEQASVAERDTKPPASTPVELTHEARTLKNIQTEMANLPDIDIDKVAAIKSLLAKGEYQVNNQQLAENMISFEELMAEQ